MYLKKCGPFVAHHALVVGADVPVADVVSPDDEDVGFIFSSVRRSEYAEYCQCAKERDGEYSCNFCSHEPLLPRNRIIMSANSNKMVQKQLSHINFRSHLIAL